jgi:drug/metabolite transporter (DMT)-like permease
VAHRCWRGAGGRFLLSTTRFYILGFGILLIFDTWTQISFKLASEQVGPFVMDLAWLKAAGLSPWICGAVTGYLGAFVTWMTLLKHAPIGPAFAASHLEVVTVLIILAVFFGEHLTPMQIIGAICIVLGILFLSLSESKHSDT